MKVDFKIGNSLDLLKELPCDSVDLIASDPPYQLDSTRVYSKGTKLEDISAQLKENVEGNTVYGSLIRGFMGKEWDVLPSVEILKECLRVLKPGAFAFWLMTPRQDSQAEFIMRLKAAGFIVTFTPIFWAYASGFPKAANAARLIDKRMGVEPEIVARNPNSRENCDKTNTIYESGTVGKTAFITKPVSEEAKKFDGAYCGFQPKPAVELIIVSMKPITEKSFVEQALKNGKGVAWMDDCRIPFANEADVLEATNKNQHKDFNSNDGIRCPTKGIYHGDFRPPENYNPVKGRFPANLLVSDDVLNDGKITKSPGGLIQPSTNSPMPNDHATKGDGSLGSYRKERPPMAVPDDEGSFSRYFDLDRWYANRVKLLPPDVQKTFPFLLVPKPAASEKNEGCEGLPKKSIREEEGDPANWDLSEGKVRARMVTDPHENFHPTVKPLMLMEYLIILGSREGDLVLDPFVGSGTTLLACRRTARRGLGFEISPEYGEIIKKRIASLPPALETFGGE